MARTSRWTESELQALLRGQAERALTPEQAAGELGVSVSQFRRYLEGVGGQIITSRFIVLPGVCDANISEPAGGTG